MVPLLTEFLRGRCVSISALMITKISNLNNIAIGLRLISCTCTIMVVILVTVFGQPLLTILDLTP